MKHQYAAQLVFDKPGRGRVYGSILETIGNTPLVRIGRLAQRSLMPGRGSGQARILQSCLERQGSDRCFDARGNGSRRQHWTRQRDCRANLGQHRDRAGFCLRCQGLSMHPDHARQLFDRAPAADEVFSAPSWYSHLAKKGSDGAIEKAKEIIAATDKAVMPWQFGHPANPEIHRRTTAEEIWRDTNGVVDASCSAWAPAAP